MISALYDMSSDHSCYVGGARCRAAFRRASLPNIVMCTFIMLILASPTALADWNRQNSSHETVERIYKTSERGRSGYSERRQNREERWREATPTERSERRRAMREHWDNMSAQERDEFRSKFRDHWDNMSPEEREMRRREMRENWKRMSPTRQERNDRHESDN